MRLDSLVVLQGDTHDVDGSCLAVMVGSVLGNHLIAIEDERQRRIILHPRLGVLGVRSHDAVDR